MRVACAGAGKQEVARAKKQAAEAATREVAALAALEEARMATSKAIAAEQAAAAAAQAAVVVAPVPRRTMACSCRCLRTCRTTRTPPFPCRRTATPCCR